MDHSTFTRIRELTQSVAADIRNWNEHRYHQRIEAERQTIEARVQEVATLKAVQLLSEQIQSCEQLTKLEQQRALWKRKAIDYQKQFLVWLGIYLSGTFPALVIISICSTFACGIGVFVGLNVLPSTVGCSSIDSWCYQWRLNKDATVAPDKPPTNKQVIPTKKKLKKDS